MTKRKWAEIDQLESPPTEEALTCPSSPIQQLGVGHQSSVTVVHSAYVAEPKPSADVASDDTSAALEGKFGPFWALLASAGYTVWDQVR